MKYLFVVVVGALFGGFMLFVDELGKYIEDINPVDQYDSGNDFEEVEK